MLFRTMNLSAYLVSSMRVAGSMRELGPYAVIALIVPGGCLIALVIWAFRNRVFLMGRLRDWQELHKSAEGQFDRALAQKAGRGSRLNRMRLNRIMGICEATHSWFEPHIFAGQASAMVFLRSASAVQWQSQERRRGEKQCLRA